ncbi:MAG TPA: metallophosphoesterase family protein [Dehalococcoidia bacterium]|nr:metallophosphoesterase family protein [Dehalococcoidia bacterium]
MRYAILADIHANLAAFQAVLDDIKAKGGADQIWCLGDVVGYGPDPHQCLELLQSYDHLCVAGNHDWAAVGKIDPVDFNPDAAAAARWTARQLTAEDIAYLENLPLTLSTDDFTLAHGSPRDPIWEYLLSSAAAKDSFRHFQSQYCLVGHSHVPLLFMLNAERDTCLAFGLPADIPLELGGRRLILNPGGVGQPRDGDPRAAYALYHADSRALYHYRIPYDIKTTQRKMLDLGLPYSLASRLSLGL